MCSLFSAQIFVLLLSPWAVWAKSPNVSYVGKVIKCHDGDTCTIKADSNRKIKVRLSGIDAPELKQKDGKVSRDFLESLVRGREVLLNCDGKSFDRLTCTIFLDSTNVNAEVVRNGFAFDVPKYSKGKYNDLMVAAKKKKLGIWQENPISPFCFRNKKNEKCKSDQTFSGK